jgi:hypothetical protein
MGRIFRSLKRTLRRKPSVSSGFDRSDRIPELRGRTVENDDAWAQAGSGGDQFPINYVPPADEGRPRH